MPKMQVYLPDELYRRVKTQGRSLNVSSVLQAALEEALGDLQRREALRELVAGFEAEDGPLTAEQLERRDALDRAEAARRSRARSLRSKRRKRAA